MIKILGGKYRGFSLKVLDRPDLRPTSVMLRRRIFDSRQDLSGIQFVDLCAGTGAMGVEALSRGALDLILNEKNFQILGLLKKNIEAFIAKNPECNQQIKIISKDFLDCLKQLPEKKGERILFFDPPYENEKMYQDFAKYCADHGESFSEIWVEADEQKLTTPDKLREYFHFLSDCKVYNQGTSYFLILKQG